jgi:hypothetical protein
MAEAPMIESSTWYRIPFGRHVISSTPPYVSIEPSAPSQRDARRRALAELARLSLPD